MPATEPTIYVIAGCNGPGKTTFEKSGHHVPAVDIRRRFGRSLRHFSHGYAPLADRWAVWDNLMDPPELLADSDTCTTAELQRMLRP